MCEHSWVAGTAPQYFCDHCGNVGEKNPRNGKMMDKGKRKEARYPMSGASLPGGNTQGNKKFVNY